MNRWTFKLKKKLLFFFNETSLSIFNSLARYTALDDIDAFNALMEEYPHLSGESIRRRKKRFQNSTLPPEYYSQSHQQEMLKKIHSEVRRRSKDMS